MWSRLFALCVLLIGLPVWLLIALAIRLDSPGPVFFRGRRIGQHGRVFRMFKFRTMHTPDRAAIAWERAQRRQRLARLRDSPTKPTEHPRITRVGRWLRRTGLDEVPQFLHVLSGRMAIVGPRPWLPYETAVLTAAQRERLRCRPGITGLWQVRGRSQLSFEQTIALDLEYVRRRSVSLDLSIIARTPWCMLTGRGGQ